ncbi:MAG: CDP-diacylglycerol--serine O-phosphatidyltransferase [Duodenibacillus sp.]|nr:CDP-diacylglycerol--serine O-phosphatidyltransferase [Duodenibacillus sp.]
MQPKRRRRPARARLVEASRRRMQTVRSRGLFVLPNLFTTASLFTAFLSIVQAMEGQFGSAALMIFLSMVFDGMDGRVARLTHTQSNFGEQFDSIADMTAFGVAPALVMYKFVLHSLGGVGWAAAFVFCLCAGIRLARFNCNIGVVDKRFFQGLPSPAAAALVAGFVWLAVEGKLPGWIAGNLAWFAFVVTVYAGLTMICNAPFFSGKAAGCVRTVPFWAVAAASLAFIFLSTTPTLAVFVLFCLYALSGWIHVAWLFFFDRPNPVLPPPPEPSEPSEPEDPVEPAR